MSLVTDPDLAIYSLRLQYLRSVVPLHKRHTSGQRISPQDAFTFVMGANHGPAESSYVRYGGYTDADAWPELVSGRESPPLLQMATKLSRGKNNRSVSGAAAKRKSRKSLRHAFSDLDLQESSSLASLPSDGHPPGPSASDSEHSSRENQVSESDAATTTDEDRGAKSTKPDMRTHDPGSSNFLPLSSESQNALEQTNALASSELSQDLFWRQSRLGTPHSDSETHLLNMQHEADFHKLHSDRRAPDTSQKISHPHHALDPPLLLEPWQSSDNKEVPDKVKRRFSFVTSALSAIKGGSHQPHDNVPGDNSEPDSPPSSAHEDDDLSPQPLRQPARLRKKAQPQKPTNNDVFKTNQFTLSSEELDQPPSFTKRLFKKKPDADEKDDSEPVKPGLLEKRAHTDSSFVPTQASMGLVKRSLPESGKSSAMQPSDTHGQLSFAKKTKDQYSAPPLPPTSSELSNLFTQSKSSPSQDALRRNPFSVVYATMISSAQDALALTINFPQSKNELSISVEPGVAVDDVIGAALFTYWQEGLEPPLDVNGNETVLDVVARWSMHIVDEDDGSIDDDFPALERTRPISAFAFTHYALVCSSEQSFIADNKAKQSQLWSSRKGLANGAFNFIKDLVTPRDSSSNPSSRTPSPFASKKRAFSKERNQASSKAETPLLGSAPLKEKPESFALPAASFDTEHIPLSVALPTMPSISSPQILMAPINMYIADVLAFLCEHIEIGSPRNYDLVVDINNAQLIVAPDKTVQSLGDIRSLKLYPKSQTHTMRRLQQMESAAVLHNTNPNISILHPQHWRTKKYLVSRRMPKPLRRQERALTISETSLVLEPASSKPLFESGYKTYPISSVSECSLARRSHPGFYVVLGRSQPKTLDFDVETLPIAQEIVLRVNFFIMAYKEGINLKQDKPISSKK